jgi:uncharacterized membrane protein YkvA (DUF1232 family)
MVTEKQFWKKVKRTMGKVPFLPDAIALYFCMIDPETPIWAKAQIAGALAYFIAPFDLIPDALPGLGYADDAGVIVATLKVVATHVTKEHKKKSTDWLAR